MWWWLVTDKPTPGCPGWQATGQHSGPVLNLPKLRCKQNMHISSRKPDLQQPDSLGNSTRTTTTYYNLYIERIRVASWHLPRKRRLAPFFPTRTTAVQMAVVASQIHGLLLTTAHLLVDPKMSAYELTKCRDA